MSVPSEREPYARVRKAVESAHHACRAYELETYLTVVAQCAYDAVKGPREITLDDLTIPARRECQCPAQNPDCEHPTCPRWPQPGHFAHAAAELVDAWETGGKGYLDLEQRIAAALAKAATR